MLRRVCVIAVLCSCVLAVPAKAQEPQESADPENEKQIGLWLDQGISTGSANESLDVEFYERFDEGASNLFEYFVQGGVAFRLRRSSYTQNRFQVGVRLPIADSFSVRPYYLLQSVNLPSGWDTNQIVGISLAFKVIRKTK